MTHITCLAATYTALIAAISTKIVLLQHTLSLSTLSLHVYMFTELPIVDDFIGVADEVIWEDGRHLDVVRHQSWRGRELGNLE